MNTESLIRKAQRRGLTQECIATITITSQSTIHRYLIGQGSGERGVKHRIEQRLNHYLQRVEFAGDSFFLRVMA